MKVRFSYFITLSLLACCLTHADDGKPLSWQFDGAEEPGQWEGKAKIDFDAAGPRSPRYPSFGNENRAAFFPGKDAYLVLKDADYPLRFGAGESITVEAWIRVKSLGRGHMIYLVGKGRHDKEGFHAMNQNYAVRLKGESGGAALGFLFSSIDDKGKRDWHRWWSTSQVPASGWHHVAVSYTFGDGQSLQGYIDGQPVDGVWDMGGITDRTPATDADDLVIGTGSQRGTSESFHGWMDNLTIHREIVAPEKLATRYAYNPPPPPVTRDMVPAGKVLVQVSESGVPEANSWPDEPQVTETHVEDVFGLFELPQKYVSTGVRGDRANPSHVRAAAIVDLPKGKHRLLLRSRGASRVMIDGKKIIENPFPGGDTGGHGKISAQDKYLDLGPDFRFVPPGNRENWIEYESPGGKQFVILETMLGGLAGKSKRRPELGETVIAISFEGSESWQLLSPGERQVPYTDEGWAAYELERREHLAKVNAKARAARRAEHADYWVRRRDAGQKFLASTDEVPVPNLPKGYPAHNAIDHFIGARIAEAASEAKASAAGSVDYFEQVQPLLESRCYDCHQGGKAKGELRLDNHAAALKGGEYDGPAITPGDIDGSSLIFRVIEEEAGDDIMPPKGDPLTADEITLLKKWVKEGAHWPQFRITNFDLPEAADDLSFLRRVALDTIGVAPTEKEIETFLADKEADRRAKAIDRLLDDPRWADHWAGYWQDVLAENPNIINPTLNNSGPFRFWIYESLLDNKPLDLMVTELIRMEGSERFGGPAGFQTASQNDVPMAAKGIIASSAFLGVEMKCARCHDSLTRKSRQEDLFQLAAMMKREPIKVPMTSSVPMERFEQTGRKALIEVTLKPGTDVSGAWPFEEFCPEETAAALCEDPKNPRDLLAALISAPQNQRFAQVMANRIWQRIMGRGIVESVGDWELAEPTHEDFLKWLGRELVRCGYDTKQLARLVLNSHAYQRAADLSRTETSPLYIAPAPRRLSAEQIVDGLFSATGKPFKLEEVSLDIDSVRALNNSLALGKPRRAWMLASTSNERDRPSLSLPRIQAVASVMETFGWRGARQNPISIRDTEPNVLQPAILANGVMGIWLTRLSDDNGITQLVLEEQPLDQLIDRLFLRLLTRKPTGEERKVYTDMLSKGYEARVIQEPKKPRAEPGKRVPVRYVSWSNHLDGPANLLAQEKEMEARQGDPPTGRLDNDWRLRMEDVLWALLNSPEWIYNQ